MTKFKSIILPKGSLIAEISKRSISSISITHKKTLFNKENIYEKKLINKKHQFIHLESFDRNLKIKFGYSEDARAEQIYSYESEEEAERSLQAYVLWKVWDLFREEDESEDQMMLRRNLLTAEANNSLRVDHKNFDKERICKAILEEDVLFLIANSNLRKIVLLANNVNLDADTALILAVKNNKIAVADYLLHSMFIDSGKKTNKDKLRGIMSTPKKILF